MPWNRGRSWSDSPCSGRTDSIYDSEVDFSYLNDIDGNYCLPRESFQSRQILDLLIFSDGWSPRTTWLAVRAVGPYEACILSLFIFVQRTRRDRNSTRTSSFALILHLRKDFGIKHNAQGKPRRCSGQYSRQQPTMSVSILAARTDHGGQMGGRNLALPGRLACTAYDSGKREGPHKSGKRQRTGAGVSSCCVGVQLGECSQARRSLPRLAADNFQYGNTSGFLLCAALAGLVRTSTDPNGLHITPQIRTPAISMDAARCKRILVACGETFRYAAQESASRCVGPFQHDDLRSRAAWCREARSSGGAVRRVGPCQHINKERRKSLRKNPDLRYLVNCDAAWRQKQENILTYCSPQQYRHLHNLGEPRHVCRCRGNTSAPPAAFSAQTWLQSSVQ